MLEIIRMKRKCVNLLTIQIIHFRYIKVESDNRMKRNLQESYKKFKNKFKKIHIDFTL